MKKIFSCILAIIILGAMLSGCSNNDSKEMIKKAKKKQLNAAFSHIERLHFRRIRLRKTRRAILTIS